VHRGCGFAPFVDGPDDQRLAAAHVAGGEDSVDGSHEVRCHDVAAVVEASPNCSIMPLRTGPKKPIASRTRSASRVNSVPAMASNFGGGPTRAHCNCFTLPFSSPMNLMLLMLQSRRPPSSCELSVRNCIGHSGHGVRGERSPVGLGMISNWCTLFAAWRWLVPRQSAPVSPPPMMMTCLPVAK